MAEKEYIELDKPITVTDTRGIEHEITVRHIFEMNKGKYEVDDVRPVVLCKDCKHRQHDEILGQSWCNGHRVPDDWFCADGEKEEES